MVPLWLFLVFVVVAFLAVAYSVYLGFLLDYYEEELSATEEALTDLNLEYQSLLSDYEYLSARYNDLSAGYDDLLAEYNDLIASYNNLLSEYNSLSEKCGSMIKHIYSWLADNAVLSEDVFEREVQGCLSGEYLNVPCVLFRRDYKYIPDDNDHAKTPYEFISDGGGDCEDFSFYVAALIRTAVERGYGIMVYRKGNGRFYLTSRWYYPNAKELRLHPSDVYVVCGYEKPEDESAHCVVRVCEGEDLCWFVESQTGEVLDDFYLVDWVFAPGYISIEGVDLGVWYDK